MLGEAQEYTAKRTHKRPCDLCGKTIVVGQLCSRWTWIDDTPMSVRVHSECNKEARTYDWYDDPDGWPDRYPLIEERSQAIVSAAPSTATSAPTEGDET